MAQQFLINPFNQNKEEINKFLIKRIIPVILILTTIILFDQVSKHYVRYHLSYFYQYKFVYHMVFIERVDNTGAFLSLGDNLKDPIKTIVLNIIPMLVMLMGIVFVLFGKNIDKANLYGISLVISGGIGNLYDRLVFKSVTDFMQIKIGFLQTGVFNIADMAIMGGMFTILIHSFLKERNAKRHLDN